MGHSLGRTVLGTAYRLVAIAAASVQDISQFVSGATPPSGAVKDAELASEGSDRQILGYAGQLGTALLLARFASRALVPNAKRIVGFDSGDFAEILDGA